MMIRPWPLLAVGLVGFPALAQPVVPDAGALRQQLEQRREPSLPAPERSQRVLNPAAATDKNAPTVNVRAFRFQGNALLSDAQLQAVVQPFIGRPLSFEELQSVADVVGAAYRSSGRLAQVSLPAQDITEGEVLMVVLEARFGGMRFDAELSQRVQPALIEALFARAQRQGEPVDMAALDRALLLADDLPGVSVAGTLAPGEGEGQTALALRSTDELPVFGEVALDNMGARSTGAQRLQFNLTLNSPTGRAELVSLHLMQTDGSTYGRLALSAPIGASGLRAGANVSQMRYTIVNGPTDGNALTIRGSSGSAGVDMSYPWVRSRSQNVYLSAALDHKTFRNSDTELRSDYASNSLTLGVSGNRFDGLGGGGANSASLQWRIGRLQSMRAHTQSDSIERGFHKLSYALTRQQTLAPGHSLLLSLSGQHATQALDSSEKFYIGGAQSVRAYPVSELGGERGQALSAEWRWRLDSSWVLSVFADVGRVTTLPMTPSDQTVSYALRGTGLSVAWQGPMGLSTRLTWAHRIGENPKPTAAGTDGDGTLRKNRWWVSTALPF